jgi:hypothetical protein
MIDLCFIEFNGEDEIWKFFAEFNFRCFSTPILFDSPEPIGHTISNMDVVKLKNMSNGHTGECLWDGSAPTSADLFGAHIRALRKQYKRSVQTDLICVAPHFMPAFLRASADYYTP